MSDADLGWARVENAWRRVLGQQGRLEEMASPADAQGIDAAQRRLGVPVPTVLRGLYVIADGLPALGADVYGIRACAELSWFRESEASLVSIWDDINRDSGGLDEYLDLMRAGLAVSKDGDEYRLLFVPTSDIPGPNDWKLYRQSNGGSGVTPEESLTDNLLDMVARYFDVSS